MNKSMIALLLLGAVLITAWSSVFTVDETELSIVTRFGKYKRTADSPGLHYKAPFIDKVHFLERRILTSDTPPAEYLTLDKKRLVADPITRWRIDDPLEFFTSVHDEMGARARLDDVVNSELRRELASRNFDEIVGKARNPMMQEVAMRTRKKTKIFGIQVVDVRIKRADLPKQVEASVFQRMRAERERAAKQYRSEGAEAAATIRAETDKQKTIILAQAYEAAQKQRGTGDAESISIYAAAYGKAPEFYAFSRSLETYEKSIDKGSTLVLSTGSDFFHYFSAPERKGGR